MYLFLTDESNKPPEEQQFFIYGGVAVPSNRVPDLHARIDAVRKVHHYAAGENLKFSNIDGKDAGEHRAAKDGVLAALAECEADLLVTVVLEQILRTQDESAYMSMAINAMTSVYHQFLTAHDEQGSLLVDRVDKRRKSEIDEFTEHARRFQTGLVMEGYEYPVNDRVLLFGMTSNNASHLSSAADIALGAFRYCVNALTRHADAKLEIARQLMPRVDALFRWRSLDGVRLGYSPYPKTFKFPGPEAKYDSLRNGLKRLTRG
jgi:hypothetical protein